MAALVDSDITSSVCFLAGVTSGVLCVALAGSWAFATHRHYTATIPDRLSKMQEGRDPLVVPTPRFPHQHVGGA